MKYLVYIFFAFSIASCSTDQSDIETRVYQVVKDGEGPLIPVTITDNDDGSGILVARILYDNRDTRFDMVIDQVTPDRSNFTFTPAPGETISIGAGTHTGTFWTDSIHMVVTYELGGFDVVDTYTGTR